MPQSYLGTPATAPGPDGPAMLAQFGLIRRDPLAFLAASWREYGDVVQFPIPRPPTYLVSDPEAVRQVLVTRARGYSKNTIQYRALALVTGQGLLVADDDVWRRQRRLVQPAFHRETLEAMVDHVGRAAARVSADWATLPPGAVVDVDEAMMHAALEIVGRALFGTDLSDDAEHLVEATLAGLDVVVARARVPVTPPSWLPTPANRRLASSVRTLDHAVLGMLAQRADGAHRSDMLGLLLASRDEDGRGLTRREIRDQVVTFIVAGHETVASALSWAWALLATNPATQTALQAESDAVLAGRTPSFADYSRLPYARAVVDEALRLYPPAWLITRSAREDDDLAGVRVPAGSLVIVSPWIVHRHQGSWTNPDDFRPERFLDGSIDRAAYLPFGAGPRLCIGRDFAYVESTLMLAALAGRFHLDLPDGLPAADPLVTIRPLGGVRARVTPRRLARALAVGAAKGADVSRW